MSIDFKALKQNRKSASEKLKEKIEAAKDGINKDSRFWRPATDKSGKAFHIIRFLQDPEQTSFEKLIKYSTKGPGGWYIENSPKTFGSEHQDPAANEKTRLYSINTEESKKKGSKIRRNVKYYANILVKKDSENPDNNGKVFLYEFGPAVYNLITKALNPEFEDEQSIDVFDMWEGTDIKLKLVGQEMPDINDPSKKRLVPSYDNIEISKENLGPIGTDEEIEQYWLQTHKLSEFVSKDKFKSFEELQLKFNRVMGIDGTEGTGHATAGDILNQLDNNIPSQDAHSQNESTYDEPQEPLESDDVIDTESTDSTEEEDALAFFTRMQNEG